MAATPNDNLYGSGSSSSGGNSGLGGNSGADSFGVTGASSGSYGAGSLSGTASDVGALDLGSPAPAPGINERLHGAKDAAADKLGQAKEIAGERLGQAKEIAGERLGQAKEKATQLKATLADKLEAGATSLRQQGTSGDAMGLEGSSTANPQLQKLADTGATALQKSAEFLRDGDLKGSIEEQVRSNPGRTLLIALGVGYALGKVLRGNDRRL